MFPKPPVAPPQEHPRLFLRQTDIKTIKGNVDHPSMKQVWDRLTYFSQFAENELHRYDSPEPAYAMEAHALMYVLFNDHKAGERAKAIAFKYLQQDFKASYQDISRTIGRLMLAGAVVYDWCYDLINEAERKWMINEFKRLASLLECGYPPVKQGAVVGHASEWMIMRDMIGTGIAIYDEDPEMYNWAAGRFFDEFVPVRNFFYPSGWYHQGDNYGSYRYQADLFAAWIFQRMGAGDVFDRSMEQVGYQWIYTRRPDGKLLRDGDTDNPLYEENKYIQLFPLVYLMAGNFYNNGYFLDQQQREFASIPDMYVFFAFLFHDPKLSARSIKQLPLTRYFGDPMGVMVARTGWEDGVNKESSTVVAEMKVGMYQYNNHQHLDAGAFQLYYKGYMAIDSGIYKGSSGKYQSPHNKYYFRRTIAHNCMLVYDPNELEQYPAIRDGGLTWPNVNDGGQRWPNDGAPPLTLDDLLSGSFKRGEVLAHQFGPDQHHPDYSYLKGDLTVAYSDKVEQYERSFVFINFKDEKTPAAFIVWDRIVSSNPTFSKLWLLHSVDEPVVIGNRTVITQTQNGYNGKLVNDTLLPLPENTAIHKVGGPGKEFWVFGTNYAQDFPATTEQGAWRIEVCPKQSQKLDYFLNVMQMQDADQPEPDRAEKLEGDLWAAVSIRDWLVVFTKAQDRNDSPIVIELPSSTRSLNYFITDLALGTWQITTEDEVWTQQVRADSGTLFFKGKEGTIELTLIQK